MTTHTPPPEDSDSLDSLLSIIYDDDEYALTGEWVDIAPTDTDDTQPLPDTELPFAAFDEGGE